MQISRVLYQTSKFTLQAAALALLVQLVIQTSPRIAVAETVQITEMWDARSFNVV